MASFYRAYCTTEKKFIQSSWSNEEKVATNAKKLHEDANPGHSVTIKTK